MVVYYEILGQKIGSHFLAMGVLGSVFAGTYAMAGGSKKNLTQQGPPINAKSKDEEDFIQQFLKSSEAESKGAKH